MIHQTKQRKVHLRLTYIESIRISIVHFNYQDTSLVLINEIGVGNSEACLGTTFAEVNVPLEIDLYLIKY